MYWYFIWTAIVEYICLTISIYLILPSCKNMFVALKRSDAEPCTSTMNRYFWATRGHVKDSKSVQPFLVHGTGLKFFPWEEEKQIMGHCIFGFMNWLKRALAWKSLCFQLWNELFTVKDATCQWERLGLWSKSVPTLDQGSLVLPQDIWYFFFKVVLHEIFLIFINTLKINYFNY